MRVEFTKFEQGPNLTPPTETEIHHDWLDPSNSVDSILAQAATSGRDDVYAWIQVAPGSDREQLKVEWQDYDVDVSGFRGDLHASAYPTPRPNSNTLPIILVLKG